MNKTRTKIDAERYVAPTMNEHVLTMKRQILDGSFSGGTEGVGTFSGNTENWESSSLNNEW